MKKEEHIKYALMQSKRNNSLESIRLKYHSIPNVNIQDVDISTKFCGLTHEIPFYINAITGGELISDNINKRLEYISKKLGIFMFSGSYSPALKKDFYYYPKNLGVNIGADKNVENIKKAVNNTNAKILQIHVNPIQEFMMTNGDINFSMWEENISEAVEQIKIPIILKETGFGMGDETFLKAISLGIKTVDISGKGGTDFSYIEDMRSAKNRNYLYNIGYSTKDSLLISQKYQDKLEILASGGIENPLDIVKCLSLGAKAVGISYYILKLLYEKEDDEIIEILKEWIYEIKAIMAITNSKNIKELNGKWEEI